MPDVGCRMSPSAIESRFGSRLTDSISADPERNEIVSVSVGSAVTWPTDVQCSCRSLKTL
jgi:hypothetical protein